MIVLYTKPVPINDKIACVRGRGILTKRYREAKIALAQEISLKWTTAPLGGTIELHIDLFYGDKRKRDIDAHLKILLDAMSEIVYEDDSQVTKMTVQKFYDKQNPRTQIEVLSIK